MWQFYKRLNLRFKLILIFILVGLIPMIALTSLSYIQTKDALTQENLDEIELFSRQNQTRLNTYFETKRIFGSTLGVTARLVNNIKVYNSSSATSEDKKKAYDTFESFIPSYSKSYGFDGIFVSDKDGLIVYGTEPYKSAIEGANIASRQYFKTAMLGKQNISEFMYSAVIEAYFIAVSTPLMDDAGVVIGTVNALVPVPMIQSMLQSEIESLGQTSDVYLVDAEGLLYTNTFRGKFSHNAVLTESVVSPAQRALSVPIVEKNLTYMDASVYINFEGREVIGGYSIVSIGESILGMIVEIDTSEALLASRKLLISNVIILLFIAVLSSILLLLFVHYNVNIPINHVVLASKKMAEGDLNLKVTFVNQDEIGMLASAFNLMAENINDVMTQINTASEQVASGSIQVADSSMSLSQGATEQASAIEELSTSIEAIAEQSRTNAKNASAGSTLAESTKEMAKNGDQMMSGLMNSMVSINNSATNISRIIKVIDDIAFQTNILALNAAVEAARAGSHGKGFAVVAEEVRNLAARSALAAKETNEMIANTIKNVTAGNVNAEKTAVTLNEILSRTEELSKIVSGIASASNDQANSVVQINIGITQIANVIQTTSSTSQQTAAASEELSSQAELLKTQVSRFKLRTR